MAGTSVSEWNDTCATLHLWTQIVGKIRLACTRSLNHSWHVTLYPTARGLTTSLIPCKQRGFEMEFDLCQHQLVIATSDHDGERIALKPRTVASFYAAVVAALGKLGIAVRITEFRTENRVRSPSASTKHIVHTTPIMRTGLGARSSRWTVSSTNFARGFIAKQPGASLWGSSHLAVTRFSGRRAPLHPGGFPGVSDLVMQEAYPSDELSSAGLWPGGGGVDFPPSILRVSPASRVPDSSIEPVEAYFDATLGEFLLPYDAVRKAKDPDATLMGFLQSTYRAAATFANWNRLALECPVGHPGIPRPIETDGR